MEYCENYWDHPELKREFIRFLNDIHRVDLTSWNEMGYWDEKYHPFSCFDNGKLVSNICIYSMDMVVNGKFSRVAQVSAVGTDPGYRRRGLSKELTQKALRWAKPNHDFFFLFADEEAFPFYEKRGFRRVDEYVPRVSIMGKKPGGVIRKLDMNREDHRDLVYRIASERETVSNKLGVLNSRLFMFWCLNFLRDCIYYIPEIDVLAIYRRKGGVVTIYDIVASYMPSFPEIYPSICGPGDRTVCFQFMTDKLGIDNCEFTRSSDNGTHLLGSFPLENEHFIFPVTAQA